MAPAASGCAPVASPPAGPVLFEAGLVSSAAPEFAITFTPDGRELYFNRASDDRSRLTIMRSVRNGDHWSTPSPAPFSGEYRDVDPFASPDGRRLYFSSTRPRTAGAEPGVFNTWYVERTAAGEWGAPIDPGAPLNSDSTDVFFSIAEDGTAAFMSGRDGPSRIYLSRLGADGWSVPRATTFGGSAEGGNPLIARDGRFMVLVLAGPADGADLHVSCRAGTDWERPVPLTAANSSFTDFAPAVDPSGEWLYFTSERPGVVAAVADSARPPGDIYRIRLSEAGARCPT